MRVSAALQLCFIIALYFTDEKSHRHVQVERSDVQVTLRISSDDGIGGLGDVDHLFDVMYANDICP